MMNGTAQEVQPVIFQDLGLTGYQEAWDYQEKLLQENVQIKSVLRQAQVAGDPHYTTQHYLLFCEHPPVYTLGKSGHIENLLTNKQQLQQQHIGFVHTNRGGDITFHGPQQIVGYPVLDLEKFFTDIGWYLRSLEQMIIATLERYGIAAGRSPGETGVWIDPEDAARARKICAIGVRCSRWITMHGFALNVNTDLSYFDHIIPCGIRGKQVTSLQKELGHPVPVEDVKQYLKESFEKIFSARLLHTAVPAL